MARVVIRSHLWISWAEIAIEHEAEARQARADAVAIQANGSHNFADELLRELRASMVCISAAAHSLDTLHEAVLSLYPPLVPVTISSAWAKHGPRRGQAGLIGSTRP